MLEYSRKYNSKHKQAKKEWKEIIQPYTITPLDWKIFDFRLNKIIYRNPTQKFKDTLSKEIMWRNLNK